MIKRKQKHNSSDDESEIAITSSIIDNGKEGSFKNSPQKQEQGLPTKKLKLKTKTNKATDTSERSETKITNEHDLACEQSNDDDYEKEVKDDMNVDLVEPTLDELRESEKPENVIAVQTVRQKKREKQQQRVEKQKDQSSDKEKQRNQEYLLKWKHSRSEWKFEKLRQISIQQNALDEEKLDDNLWTIALEYLSGSKGTAKEKIIKMTEQIIEQLDEQNTDNEAHVINSTKYKRARELLQCLH